MPASTWPSLGRPLGTKLRRPSTTFSSRPRSVKFSTPRSINYQRIKDEVERALAQLGAKERRRCRQMARCPS